SADSSASTRDAMVLATRTVHFYLPKSLHFIMPLTRASAPETNKNNMTQSTEVARLTGRILYRMSLFTSPTVNLIRLFTSEQLLSRQ
ncbi:MAG TPA: hypothetical protein PLQ98_02835, partial [Bacillota bacterium]|nr:hypothetical protein [Bacillota bacterium]